MNLEPTPSLLQQIRANESRGWARLLALVSPVVLAVLRRRHVQDADAAAILSDVSLALTRHMPEYTGQPPFAPWLFQLVQWRLRDTIKGNKKHGAVGGSDILAVAHEQPDPATVDEFEDFRLDLLRQAQDMVRKEVSAQEWSLFARVVLGEEDYKDVAEELKILPGPAYQIVFRIKKRLRELLLNDREES